KNDFDPRIDTVVRSEARRLRSKLSQYYHSEGSDDPIEILLPKGSYRAAFRSRTEALPAAPQSSKSRTIWLAAGVVIAVASASLYWYTTRTHKSPASGKPPSIAVLPFENLSADPNQEYLSDGVTETLITDLAKIRALAVIARTSVAQFKKTRTPIPEIAKQLGV